MGNTSLAGARWCLSRQAREPAEQLARRTEHVDCRVTRNSKAFAEAMISRRHSKSEQSMPPEGGTTNLVTPTGFEPVLPA